MHFCFTFVSLALFIVPLLAAKREPEIQVSFHPDWPGVKPCNNRALICRKLRPGHACSAINHGKATVLTKITSKPRDDSLLGLFYRRDISYGPTHRKILSDDVFNFRDCVKTPHKVKSDVSATYFSPYHGKGYSKLPLEVIKIIGSFLSKAKLKPPPTPKSQNGKGTGSGSGTRGKRATYDSDDDEDYYEGRDPLVANSNLVIHEPDLYLLDSGVYRPQGPVPWDSDPFMSSIMYGDFAKQSMTDEQFRQHWNLTRVS